HPHCLHTNTGSITPILQGIPFPTSFLSFPNFSMISVDDLNKSLGGILGGTWANSYWFMIEIIMCYQYFSRY
ncbi:hypothetical protein WG66_009747, partial [Moniliophthora roreri]